MRQPHDAFRHRSEKQSLKPGSSVRWHDDQLRVFELREFGNPVAWVTELNVNTDLPMLWIIESLSHCLLRHIASLGVIDGVGEQVMLVMVSQNVDRRHIRRVACDIDRDIYRSERLVGEINRHDDLASRKLWHRKLLVLVITP